MKTLVYVKTDTREQLLLSESICRLGGEKMSVIGEGYVPTVRVQLMQTVKKRTERSVMAEVRLVGDDAGGERLQLSGGVKS